MHNNIKLSNILIGVHDPEQIYLIDFALSHSYLTESGAHIEPSQLDSFKGNFKFASFNGCAFRIQSRRDDIISVMILMVYLLNNRKLPWSGFS